MEHEIDPRRIHHGWDNRLEPRGDLDTVTRSVRLGTVTFDPSVILNGVKTLSYAANMAASRQAAAAGYDEAVLVSSGGIVLEGPTCSIFCRTPDYAEDLAEPSLLAHKPRHHH
jgi:branched-subunit amino acid aminotransferase/4-amino-4-deoxychorismate lyase